MERRDIVRAYWESYREAAGGRIRDAAESSEWFWGWEAVHAEVHARSDDLVDLLVELAEAADNDDQLGYLGADAIEQLLRHEGYDFAEPLLPLIDAAARTSTAFRTALTGVWFYEDDHPEVVALLKKSREPTR